MTGAFQRILALVPNWLGDAAMCTPALRALRRAYPDAEITAAGRSAVCELLAGLPSLTQTVTLPARPGGLALARAAWALRPCARDVAVVFPHSFRAALLARLACARRRVGHDREGRGWLLTDRVEPYREGGVITPIYMAHEYLEVVAAIGCADDGLGLELAADRGAVDAVRAHFAPGRPRVGIAPGAAFGPSKLWPADRYAAVADALTQRAGAQCVLLTGPGEELTRDAVIRAAKTPFVNLDGIPGGIGRLKAAVSQLDLLVGNDSGTRHVAVAFHVPTICIMGPTSPAYSAGPYERGRVLRLDVDCGPCQKPVCATDHRCMTGISTDSVVEAALEFLH